MSFIKKITAAAAAAAMLLSLTACGSNTRIAANAGTLEIPAGVFIYYQSVNVSQASYKLPEGADPKTALIEEKTSDQWILDETDKSMKRFAAIENIFAEKGYELSEEDKASIEEETEYRWSTGEEAFTEQGIAKSSIQMIVANGAKERRVFLGLYGEGGEKEYPQSEVKKYVDDNYAYVKYIAVQLKAPDGTLYKDDEKKTAKELAQSYITRSAEEDFNALMEEYETKYEADYLAANGTETSEKVTTLDGGTEKFSNMTMVDKNSTYPSEAFVNAAKSAQYGKAVFIDDSNSDIYYVAEFFKVSDDTELVNTSADSIRYEACGEEFEKYLSDYTDSHGFTKNQAAYNRYKMGLADLTTQ